MGASTSLARVGCQRRARTEYRCNWLCHLGDELFLHICDALEAPSLGALGSTSSTMARHLSSEAAWRQACYAYGGPLQAANAKTLLQGMRLLRLGWELKEAPSAPPARAPWSSEQRAPSRTATRPLLPLSGSWFSEAPVPGHGVRNGGCSAACREAAGPAALPERSLGPGRARAMPHFFCVLCMRAERSPLLPGRRHGPLGGGRERERRGSRAQARFGGSCGSRARLLPPAGPSTPMVGRVRAVFSETVSAASEGFRDNETWALGPLVGGLEDGDTRSGAQSRERPTPRFHHTQTVLRPSTLAVVGGHNFMVRPILGSALLSFDVGEGEG
eukprot:s9372_g4.t1